MDVYVRHFTLEFGGGSLQGFSIGACCAAASRARWISPAESGKASLWSTGFGRASAEKSRFGPSDDGGAKTTMNSRLLRRFRLALLAAMPIASFSQAVPVTRVVVVDSSGAPGTAPADQSRPEAAILSTVDRNEAAAVESCQNYVDAQLAYFRSSHRADGYLAFAEKIRSSPGAHDGLYWDPDVAGDESPVGPKFAAAAAAELNPGEASPHFGYYVKILLAQGPEAVGGARDYRVDGRLISGFALIAWPAEYGVTGFRSFQINQLGEVYAKDLGSGTARNCDADDRLRSGSNLEESRLGHGLRESAPWIAAVFVLIRHVAALAAVSRAGPLAEHCYAGKARVEVQPGADFARYKTYRWLPPKVLTSSGVVENHPVLGPLIKDAINRQLAEKGLREVAEGGDLEVSALALRESIPQLEAVVFGGPNMMYGTPIATMGRYNHEGTLIVNLIDTRTKKSAWVGYGEGDHRSRRRDRPEEAPRRRGEAVQEISVAEKQVGAVARLTVRS